MRGRPLARHDPHVARPASKLPKVDPSTEPVPDELRDNPYVKYLENMTPEEKALFEKLGEFDREGPPPGTPDEDPE